MPQPDNFRLSTPFRQVDCNQGNNGRNKHYIFPENGI